MKIISGGQFGADLGALEGARMAGIETGGTAPNRFLTEQGRQRELLTSYGLVEGPYDAKIYPKRSMKNVDDADATLAILWGNSVGTSKTIGYAQTHIWQYPIQFEKSMYKPVLVIQTKNLKEAEIYLRDFMMWGDYAILNVAGHRESSQPGIQEFVKLLIYNTFKL